MTPQETASPASPRLAYSEKDLDALGLLTRKTRWRMRRDREFPEPVVAGGRKLYRAVDIHAWLDNPEAWAKAQREKVAAVAGR